ncbi:hypothetical protein KAH55_00430 [bacterium]|nr:hypothetical protein [bacterium]
MFASFFSQLGQSSPEGFAPYYWPVITKPLTIGALVIGLLVIIFSLFAGLKENKGAVITCVIFAGLLGFIAKGILNWGIVFLIKSVKLTPQMAYWITDTLWITFVSFCAIALYESLIITTKETFHGR